MRKLTVRFSALAAFAAAFALSTPTLAQQVADIDPDQIITDPGRVFPDDWDYEYGCSVAVDGRHAAVYAAGLDVVFIYQRQGQQWNETQRISVESANCTVALQGRTLILGDGDVLRVFARQGNTWESAATIEAEDGAALANAFLDGDTVAATGDGAAYVFVRNDAEWTQQARITPQGATAATALALDDDTLLLAEDAESTDPFVSRAVYVFVRQDDTWSQQQQLIPSDEVVQGSLSGTRFGIAGALDGDTAVIGAPFDAEIVDDEGIPLGAAFVFVRDDGVWTQQQKLTTPLDPDPAFVDYEQFGAALVIQNDLIVVGAPGPGAPFDIKDGTIFGFVRDQGEWTLTFRSSIGGLSFGESLSLSGQILVVGSTGLPEIFRDGRVAFYDLRPPPRAFQEGELEGAL